MPARSAVTAKYRIAPVAMQTSVPPMAIAYKPVLSNGRAAALRRSSASPRYA
jgi:hypothetical protein